jgi:predicted negative regulator of RcsB-dependent stress response
MRRDPAVAVIVNLRAIERLYRQENRSAELPGLYADVLKRTEDPLVRNFANYRLARMELREQDAKGALEALRRNLNENLARLGTRPAG